MRRWIKDQSLSLFFGIIFLAALVGQAVAGNRAYNEDAAAHGSETISLGRYVRSSDYGQAVLENWQSEYLQFLLFVLATIWLLQKGSPESPEQPGLGSDAEQKVGRYADSKSPAWARVGGMRQVVYSYSLLILMSVIFVGAWFGQSVTGWTRYNDEQREHDQAAVGWGEYVTTASFWEETLQNWQSEFLAVGSMAVFAIYLRARGSAESKKVGEPHEKTGGGG